MKTGPFGYAGIVLALVICAVTAMAGEPAASPEAAGPAGPAGPAQTAAQKMVNLARKVDNLFDRVEMNIGMTGILQGSCGAESDFSAEEDVAAASGSLDLDLFTEFDDMWSSYIMIEGGSGRGVDYDLPFLVGVNDDADDDENLRVTEFWVEGNWSLGGEHKLRMQFGKIDVCANMDDNAIAENETSQFLGSGFTCNPAFYAPDKDFGGIVEYSYGEKFKLQFAMVDSDENDNDDEGHDRGGKFFDELFFTTGVIYSTELFGQPGNYRVYLWYDNNRLEGVSANTGADDPEVGLGLSFDQGLSENLTAFLRYGLADEDYYAVDQWISGGLALSGGLWSRDDDVLGVAYGVAVLGHDFEENLRANDQEPDDEHHLEVYYRYVMNEHMEMSPSVQFVGNPGGDSDNDGVTVFGVRLQVTW